MAKPPSSRNLIHKKIGADVHQGGYGNNSKPALKFTTSNPDPATHMTGGVALHPKKNPRMAAAKAALVRK